MTTNGQGAGEGAGTSDNGGTNGGMREEVTERTTNTTTNTTSADNSAGDDDGNDDEPFDRNRAMDTIRNLRGVERDLRKSNKEMSDRLKTIEDASKTELQRVTEERDSLKQENETLRQAEVRRTTERAFTAEAEKAGATKPNGLLRLAMPDLTIDENGNPTNTATVIKNLKTEYPELFTGTGNVDAGAGRSSAPKTSGMSELIRAQRRGRG